ncbi:hypothetical protein DAI22_12g088900 [Oryza sativa Japonica Group]|nr:hypothetical protein DAI22_12g088900 [Oryza sativa Japonica Group]
MPGLTLIEQKAQKYTNNLRKRAACNEWTRLPIYHSTIDHVVLTHRYLISNSYFLKSETKNVIEFCNHESIWLGSFITSMNS